MLPPAEDYDRLLQYVARLQSEVARLQEDNLQLRCALCIYSEAARQSLAADSEA
jgi:hypothetical protein